MKTLKQHQLFKLRRSIQEFTHTKSHKSSGGFTIIELMIASTVFSVMLLLATFGLLQIGRIYYKGVTQAKTQAVARSSLDRITQSLQYSLKYTPINPIGGDAADPPHPQTSGFCIDDHRFSYLLSNKISDDPQGSHEVHHVLVEDDTCLGEAQDLGNNDSTAPPILGTELLSPNMRLTKMSVEEIPGANSFKVTIRVVYGDNDLLCSPSMPVSGPKDCSLTTPSDFLGQEDLTCKMQTGSQFCATSELSTTVTKRLR